jgi:DNA topoisomerase-1
MTKLVIVESPAKCAKIQSFLGNGWTVLASMGHIRALQEKLDAVGVDRDWTPIYEEIAGKRDQIARLKKAAKAADEVWLATDDDREGEGIAWHICQILKLGVTTTPRIVFHEITRSAIEAAVATPGRLNMSRVNAQQARAMLDMLVGFTISRVLWKRVAPRLSAGRCQTPALRLVVERDREIDAYEARNFWRLRASAAASANTANTVPQTPLAIEADGEHNEADVRAYLATAAKSKDRRVLFGATKERTSTAAAPAPLITSTLQQEASACHGLGPKATMAAAQKLYEAGHITYMRTDNPVLSDEAAAVIRGLVTSRWGEAYVGSPGQHGITLSSPPQPQKKGAKKAEQAQPQATQPQATQPQAAHEAIRPTHPEIETISGLEHAQEVVYRLIWRRAMQSQMAPAKTEVRQATLTVPAIPATRWSAEQSRPLFEGWRILDHTEKTEASQQAAINAWATWTPWWRAGADVCWESLGADEIFTRPPGRYTEAMLIRELEKRGIGRPSTFASLVSTLFDREYIEKTNKEGKPYTTRHLTLGSSAKEAKETTESHKAGAERNKVAATPLGVSVVDCLVAEDGFADLFAYDFTAGMEAGLDQIAEGSKAWKSILQETWATYKDRYEAAMAEKDKRHIVVGNEGDGACAGTSDTGYQEGVAKVVQTKKGPLLVRELPGGKAEFAQLPKGITAANAAEKLTAEAVAVAFAAAKEAKEGELLGMWVKEEGGSGAEEGVEIRKKKGPYGFYVEAGGVRIPWKDDMSLEAIVDALAAKEGAFERTVGPYILKQGPYGYYFYKKTASASKGKPKFVGLPKDADPATVTEEALTAAAAAQPKKTYVKKTKSYT